VSDFPISSSSSDPGCDPDHAEHGALQLAFIVLDGSPGDHRQLLNDEAEGASRDLPRDHVPALLLLEIVISQLGFAFLRSTWSSSTRHPRAAGILTVDWYT
jgi:hypothetical protein